jgi:L-threonylcarbamoyladenylate synthase
LLEAVLGGLATGPGNETIARSPGLETRHYAPLTPMMSFDDYREAVQHVADSRAKGHSVLLIVFEDRQADIVLSAIPSMAESALYAALHRADAGCPDLIVVVLPPDQPEWWAVRDRLKRASRGMDLLQA